jgi:hypothetical protein
MLFMGVLCGLAAALCQSLAYLATRHFVHPRGGGGNRQLLVLAHFLMGLASVAILPLIWPAAELRPALRVYAVPMVVSTLCYLLGQIGLLMTLRYAEPSRVSPMLAFKLIVLVGMTLLLTNRSVSPLQWLAVGLCLAGALSLNYTGGTNHPKAMVGLVVACIAYSISDWNIGLLVRSFDPVKMPVWQVYAFSVLGCYTFAGVLSAMLLPVYGSKRRRDWLDAAPFAVIWLLAMLFLFASFGAVGVVYGNILQSTRGIISVLLGSLLAGAGLLHFEKAAAPGVFVRRFAAATLIVAAAVLYGLEVRRLSVPMAPANARSSDSATDAFCIAQADGNAVE